MRMLGMMVAVLVLATGCRPGLQLPPTVPVTGKISLGGKPVENATVSLTAISEGLPGDKRYVEAITNADGEYSLPKVYLAEYMVQVFKIDPAAAPANPDQAVANPFANSPFALYGNESPLRAVVTKESTRFDFELDPKKKK